MCLSSIGFAGTFFFVHIAEKTYSFPPTSSAFLRALMHTTFASVYIVAFLPIRTLFCRLSYRQRLTLFFRGAAGSLGNVLLFIALSLLPVGDAIAIFFISPVLTMLISHIVLSESITCLEMLAGLISSVGVVLVAQPGPDSAIKSIDRILGSVSALASAFFSAVAYVSVRSLGGSIHFMMSVLSLSAATIVSAAAMGGAIGPIDIMSMKEGAILAIISALFAFIGQCCLNKGLQLCRAGPGILIRNLDVPIAYTLGLIFLGEEPSWIGVFGSFLVISGTLMIALRQLMRHNF